MKLQYRQFCLEHDVPLHHQAWWLDAVCGQDAWTLALATDKGGAITGVLPYYPTRRYGLPVIQQPPFTTYSGPWLHYPKNAAFKQTSQYAFEKKTYLDLITQLPHVAFFQQNFRPEVTNHLPFFWAGFRQTTRYTYLFEDTSDLEKLVAGFKNTLRTELKKAAGLVDIGREDSAFATIFELNAQSFGRKGQAAPYRFDIFKRLHAALAERGHCAGFIARDRRTGAAHAGLYLIHDAQRAAVLLAGIHPEHTASNALSALYYEALRFCSARSLSLDFEGSMEPGIEHTFRSFGATLTPYFQVWKAGNKLLEIAFALRK